MDCILCKVFDKRLSYIIIWKCINDIETCNLTGPSRGTDIFKRMEFFPAIHFIVIVFSIYFSTKMNLTLLTLVRHIFIAHHAMISYEITIIQWISSLSYWCMNPIKSIFVTLPSLEPFSVWSMLSCFVSMFW